MRWLSKYLLAFWATVGVVAAASAETITVVTEHLPPFQFVADGELKGGIATEVVQALLKEAGFMSKIEVFPWARAYKMAQEKKNVLIFSLARSPQRETEFKWVGAIYPLEDYFWALEQRQDIAIDKLDAAKRYLVGVPRDDNQHQFLLEQGFTSPQNLYLLASWSQAIKMLYAKRLDLIVGSPLLVSYNTKLLGLDSVRLKSVYKLPKSSEVLYIAFSKTTSDELVEKFCRAYEAIKRNGTYDAIIKKWLDTNTQLPVPLTNQGLPTPLAK